MPLTVCEIFTSILGESSLAGLPAFFIRLTGCNLRCRWCDTPYAYEGGEEWSVAGLTAAARSAGEGLVLVTGGEPLLQAETGLLLEELSAAGFQVLLETNGSRPIQGVDCRVRRILDVKCPGSGMAEENHWPNLQELTPQDEVKFVIQDRADFDYAVKVIREHRLAGRLPLLISPVFGKLPPAEAAAWIVASRLPLRLNLQLHNYIWGPEQRGV
jgi:7-carboxy-7-deazaguanine synthase